MPDIFRPTLTLPHCLFPWQLPLLTVHKSRCEDEFHIASGFKGEEDAAKAQAELRGVYEAPTGRDSRCPIAALLTKFVQL